MKLSPGGWDDYQLIFQAKASRNHIISLHGDEVKVAITAPLVDGQANIHLIKFVAKQFKVVKVTSLLRKVSWSSINNYILFIRIKLSAAVSRILAMLTVLNIA